MGIITLTTDFGEKDYYVGVVKAKILALNKQVNIIDISHQIIMGDFSNAVFQVSACIHEFPKGTVHIIGVKDEISPTIFKGINEKNKTSQPSILLYRGQYFLSVNDDFFSLLVGDDDYEGFWRIRLDILKNKTFRFPTKNILVPVATALMNKIELGQLGIPDSFVRKKHRLQAFIDKDAIIGHIIHVDYYGNAITNISKQIFQQKILDLKDEGKDDIQAAIELSNRNKIGIGHSYSAANPGDAVSFFNDIGNLEIAMNEGVTGRGGCAASLMGLKIGDSVVVRFTYRGSAKNINELF